jgi:hypothetical protein
MAEIAFTVMLETGVLVQAVPLWEVEFDQPETFGNPVLIAAIRREGVLVDALSNYGSRPENDIFTDFE